MVLSSRYRTICVGIGFISIKRWQDLKPTTQTLETIAAQAIPIKRSKSSSENKSSSHKEEGLSDKDDISEEALGHVAMYA
ncbi:hypothetical protein IV203_014692 [Nitzschia inconspicua]|uniref:Uncharacterized protein n=1 Tax=Nitzschia inconspicua TaxID=303405 RepID=A0A9K3PSD4_9STRA|nr:hypothetical protein IV203_014692 [Nitzschia inconspicua]